MDAIETITASTEPQIVAMNTTAVELHNAIGRRLKQNPQQPRNKRGIFTKDRQADFDIDKIQKLPNFQTWTTLAEGVKLQYGGYEFIKGRGNDEERLMRRLCCGNRPNYCMIEGCPNRQQSNCQKMCTQCFRNTTGKAGPKHYCKIEGCPKQKASGRRGMCTQCFKDITGETVPTRKQRVYCSNGECPKQQQSHCGTMCKQCFQEITGEILPKQKTIYCSVEKCPKQRTGGCGTMCRQCFKDNTGKK